MGAAHRGSSTCLGKISDSRVVGSASSGTTLALHINVHMPTTTARVLAKEKGIDIGVNMNLVFDRGPLARVYIGTAV